MTREEAIEILRHYDDLVWQDKNKVTMGMVADAIRMGEEALQSPWKSVKEELPKDYDFVVACVHRDDDNSLIMLDYRMPNNKWGLHNELEYTHWMPIPELPKEKEDAE